MTAKMIATGSITSATSSQSSSTHSRVSYYVSKSQALDRHELTDDGLGSFGPDGTIDYAGKFLNVRFVNKTARTEGYRSDHEDAGSFEASSGRGNSAGGRCPRRRCLIARA